MLTTEEKITYLLTKLTSQKNQKLLKDVFESGISYGRFTIKQTEMIERMFQNVSQLKTNQQASSQSVHKEPDLCIKCNDVGVVVVLFDGIETLGLCDCHQGDRQPWALLRALDHEQRPVPVEWFIPKIKSTSQGETVRFIEQNKRWWREKIGVAEEFWKSHQP